MKRALASAGVALTVLVTAACTPTQIQNWMGLKAQVQATPELEDDQALDAAYDALPDPPADACAEWFWWAIEAGWTYEQWPFLSQTMWAESRCNPNAKSPAGARGLMQEMPFWAKRCGITVEMLYNPLDNLKCALVTFHSQGKTAWDGWNRSS